MPPTSVQPSVTDAWLESGEKKKKPPPEQMMYLCGGMKHKQSNLLNMKPLVRYTDSPLYEAYYPFFMGMKLLGLFHSKEYITKPRKCKWFQKSEFEDEHAENIPSLNKRITASSIYSLIMMLLMWANLFRMMYIFKDGNDMIPIVMTKAASVCWILLITMNTTACFLATHKYGNIPEFFYEWGRMHLEFPGMDIFRPQKDCFDPHSIPTFAFYLFFFFFFFFYVCRFSYARSDEKEKKYKMSKRMIKNIKISCNGKRIRCSFYLYLPTITSSSG